MKQEKLRRTVDGSGTDATRDGAECEDGVGLRLLDLHRATVADLAARRESHDLVNPASSAGKESRETNRVSKVLMSMAA